MASLDSLGSDENSPLARMTLKSKNDKDRKTVPNDFAMQNTGINLYDTSQQEALAMFYLSERSMASATSGADVRLEREEGEGDMPYRVHRRIMGWKLTTPKKRHTIIRILDQLSIRKTPLNKLQQQSLEGLATRQAGAVFGHANRMLTARDSSSKGMFLKLQREKAGDPRGSNRADAVSSKLLQSTDRAGLHRDIALGVSASEFEPFIDAVRAKSRERNSRSGTGSGSDTPGRGAAAPGSAQGCIGIGMHESIATATSSAGAATASRFGLLVGEEEAELAWAEEQASPSRNGALDSPINANRLSPTTVDAPVVAGIPPLGSGREYESLALSQLGPTGEWEYMKYEHPIDKAKWTDFKVRGSGRESVPVPVQVQVQVPASAY